MKYSVTINNKDYHVEIVDINTRPVIAYVDGQRVEVIPDAGQLGKNRIRPDVQQERGAIVSSGLKTDSIDQNPNEMTAPLPGTILDIFVKAGDVIEAGQVVVIIEAMKMKNSIRSVHAGKIAEVMVKPMQTVAHKQQLVRFE